MLQTLAIIAFTSYDEFSKYFIPFGMFLLLKGIYICYLTLSIVFIHYRTYKKVIYKDDGRDYVDFKEFISIHVTFSVLHSWVTYFLIFNFFRSMDAI